MMSAVPFLTIMIDKTTDASNREQVLICFRWVNESLEPYEELIGLYQVKSTAAETLLTVIHDVLQRLNISVSKQ